MGVTKRHLFLLEVNLNKQKSKHYDDSRRNYRCPSRRGGNRRNRSPHPRRWQKATTTKEGQESQERQKEGQESQESQERQKEGRQESPKGPKGPKRTKGRQKIQKGQEIQEGPKD